MKQNNPFVIGGYISPYYFCDRETEKQQLIKNLVNGRNTAIISTRRMGKTGLIKHCFYQKEIEENYYLFFIDIYATGSLREFVYALGKEIFEVLKPRGKRFLEHFFSTIASLRAGFRLDGLTGEPVFDIGLGDIQTAEITLDEIFRYLEQADKPCIVAFDEFQQIAGYAESNVEALLRTKAQHCKNTSFVFAGSQRHIMSQMFQSPARPFYQSVSMMHLDAIPLEYYQKFVKLHFLDNDKNIEEGLTDYVYQLMEGHTWYLQMLFNELFSLTKTGQTATMALLNAALENCLTAQNYTYQEILYRLSEKQKEILIAIAKEGKATEIMSGKFIKKHKLSSPSSVQAAIKGLMDKDIVTQENSVYQVYDRFFGLWLKKQYEFTGTYTGK